MPHQVPRDAPRRAGRPRPRARPCKVELLVVGAPGLLGPAAFMFESALEASAFAVTLRRTWPAARLVLTPRSGVADPARPAAG